MRHWVQSRVPRRGMASAPHPVNYPFLTFKRRQVHGTGQAQDGSMEPIDGRSANE